MKGRKKMVLVIMAGVVLLFGGIHLFLSRYYYYNQYNIPLRKEVMDTLKEQYNQKFKLLSTEFETKKLY